MGNALELPRHNHTTLDVKSKYSQMYSYLPDEKHINMFKAIYINKYRVNMSQIFVLNTAYNTLTTHNITPDSLIQQSFLRNASEKPPVIIFYRYHTALDTAALTSAGYAGAYKYSNDHYITLSNNATFQEIIAGQFIIVFMNESPDDLKRIDQLIPTNYDLRLDDYCNVLDYATEWKIPADSLIELSAVYYHTHENLSYYLVMFGEKHARNPDIGYLEIMEALRRNITTKIPIYFYYEDAIDYASITQHTYLPVNEPQDFKHGIIKIDTHRRKTLREWFIAAIKNLFDDLGPNAQPAEYFVWHMFMTYTLGFLCIRDIIYGKRIDTDAYNELPAIIQNIIKKARYTQTTQTDIYAQMSDAFDSKKDTLISALNAIYHTSPDPPQFPTVSHSTRDKLYAIHMLNYTRNITSMIHSYANTITVVLKKEPFNPNFYSDEYYARFSFLNFPITDTLLCMSIHSIPHDAVIVTCMGETHRQFTYATLYLMSKTALDPQDHAILYPDQTREPFQVYQSDNFINLSDSAEYLVKNGANIFSNYTGQVDFKQQIFDLLITLQANIDANTMEISGGNSVQYSPIALLCAIFIVVVTFLISCWAVISDKLHGYKKRAMYSSVNQWQQC